jgi:hypothetical protein
MLKIKTAKSLKCLLFSALTICSFGCNNIVDSTVSPQIDAKKETRTLRLYIQEDLSEITVNAISVFCEKVALLSDNTLVVESVKVKDPIEGLDVDGDFAVMSSETTSRGDGNFKIFESPFYFSDYKHLTLTLNSENFIKMMKETTGSLLQAKPLAAFYAGNMALLTIRDLSLDVIEQYDGLKIATSEDELTTYFFEQIGAETIKTAEHERLAGFYDGKYQTIEFDTLKLCDIKMPVDRTTINICESFHTPRIVWFIQSNKTKFSKVENAILAEATSYSVANHDSTIKQIEKQGFGHIASLGSSLYVPDHGAFQKNVQTVLEASARYYNLWDWKLYEQIQSLT